MQRFRQLAAMRALRIIPILLGVVGSHVIAAILAAAFGQTVTTDAGSIIALGGNPELVVYDPRVIRIAALFAMLLSFSPKFAALVTLMPEATMSGISLILYGMISAVGVRNIVENEVDLAKSRNIIIAAIILVLAIGISYGPGSIDFAVGKIVISFSGLAVASIVGIFLNAVLPGMDHEFKKRSGKYAKK